MGLLVCCRAHHNQILDLMCFNVEQHEFGEGVELEQPVSELEDEIVRHIELLEEKKQNLIDQHQGECQQLEEHLGREYRALEAKLLEMQGKKMEELNRKKEEVHVPPHDKDCETFCTRLREKGYGLVCMFACLACSSRFHESPVATQPT